MLVSVIIPTYNAENTIESTLQSVINQKGNFDLEIIVIDDGSSDNTIKIAEGLASQIIAFETNSGGPNRGRNAGLEYSSGDYICFIDQDDVWFSGKIQQQLLCMAHFNILICSTEYQVNDTENQYLYEIGEKQGIFVEYPQNEVFRQILARNDKARKKFCCYLGSIMIHKNLKYIQFETNFGKNDFDWLLNILENQKVAKVSSILMQRNINSNNLSLNQEYRDIEYYYSLMTLNKYAKQYPKEVSIAEKRINGSFARYLYQTEQMKLARKFFRKAPFHWKTIAYILSSFYGSSWVKSRFRVFG